MHPELKDARPRYPSPASLIAQDLLGVLKPRAPACEYDPEMKSSHKAGTSAPRSGPQAGRCRSVCFPGRPTPGKGSLRGLVLGSWFEAVADDLLDLAVSQNVRGTLLLIDGAKAMDVLGFSASSLGAATFQLSDGDKSDRYALLAAG